MNAVQGAAAAGARQVVAVDNSSRSSGSRPLASEATHTAASIGEAVGLVSEITWGRNADRVILTVGLADGAMIALMMAMVRQGGRAVVTAVANMYATDVNSLQPGRPHPDEQATGRHDLRFGQPAL